MKVVSKNHIQTVIGLILFLTLFSAVSAQNITASENFRVQKIAKNVYAIIRQELPLLWFNSNTVFIIGKKHVTVVDSNISSEYTKEVLAALRKLPDKPVRFVINTHWHEDHIIGNHVYRDAFPNAEFIGHKSTLTDLPTIGAANRRGSIENGQGFVELLRAQIAKGEKLAGQKITEEEKLGYSSNVKLVESYLAEAPNFQIILPTITVENKLELNGGALRDLGAIKAENKMRRHGKLKPNISSRDKRLSIPTNVLSKDEIVTLNQINPLNLDFSKRSHQAAFGVLFNSIIYSKKS